MTYDADGNLTRRWRLAGGFDQLLSWNSLGQLTSVTTNGVMVSLAYDGFGRRVRKSSSSGTSSYLWDGDNLFAELDGSGNRVIEYTYYPNLDQPHSMRRWSAGVATMYYFATDHPGNVVGVINASRQLVARYDYRPFGTIEDSSGTLANRLRFAGRELDGETGLYYLRARYYDPSLGRFLSEDATGLAGGINSYVYADNDPVNRTDPLGLCPEGTEFVISVSGTGEVTAECVSNGGSGGGVRLAPVVVTASPSPWPFSTPRSQGWTSNFGNPRARGSSLVFLTTALTSFSDRAAEVRRLGHERFPGEERSPTRHFCASYTLTTEYGSLLTRSAGVANELQGFVRWDLLRMGSRLEGRSPWAFQWGDLVANERGIQAALRPHRSVPEVCR